MPPASKGPKISRLSPSRKAVITLALALVLLGAHRLLSPSAPAIRFIRFDTTAQGERVAICRLTNSDIAPVGLIGYGLDQLQWFAERSSTGTRDPFPYLCGMGMSFHALGPYQSREVAIPLSKGSSEMRYGLCYDVPFGAYRSCREWLRDRIGQVGTNQMAWLQGMPE